MSRIEGDAAAAPLSALRRHRTLIVVSVPLLVLAAGLYLWLTGGRTVSTDNAYVGAHVVSVAPEVSGRVVEVSVAENQPVAAGQTLYRIDPEPYRIALQQADAAVGNARIQIAQLESGYTARVADVGTKASDLTLARENFRRQQALLARGFTTRADYDAAAAAVAAARSERDAASATARSAQAMLGISNAGGHPQVEAAMAQREKARLDLARTVVRAPIGGVVSQTDRLNVGTMATQMLGNVSIVGGDYWIEANFKETQLAKIRVGQPAEVEIDAIPGRRIKAHVASIGAGTGSEFSLLPAQNATGNWVKVTQRVPVRLRLDEPVGRPLVSGWSAQVTVRIR